MKQEKPRSESNIPGFAIRTFRRTDLDYVIDGQMKLYAAEYGFTSEIWKQYLTGGVREFADRFDGGRDCMYIAEHDRVPCGCIAITHTDEMTAQLRFYFIEQELRGRGAGHRLIDLAIGFCREKAYGRVFLWTFSTLEAARHLYAGSGFRITDTSVNSGWGEPILEEKWELEL